MAETRSLGIWAPYKDILATAIAVIHHKKFEKHLDLQSALFQYRPAFISLLQNPPKNGKQREEVKKATKEGLRLEGHTGLVKLTKQVVQDVLILSDALDLNEFSCVELLFAAEQQLPNFPGLSVRDIALLLYHDGRRCLLSTLKILIDAQTGLSWTYEVDESTSELIDGFLQKLYNDGLLNKILQLLETNSSEKELATLESSQLVGNGKHKKLLKEVINEERVLLADCLCRWACQAPFDTKTCINTINYLKGATSTSSDGSVDKVLLRVLMSLLVSLGTEKLDSLSEGLFEKDKSLPVMRDSTFISELHKTISRPDGHVWQIAGLKALLQFSWAIFLRTCSQLQELASYTDEDIFEEDEGILDAAIESDAFKYLKDSVIDCKGFVEEDYFLKTIHSLVTSFLVKFPLKTKELRNKGDENARIVEAHLQEGYDLPQGLRHDFQDLMLMISQLYAKDPSDLRLSLEYWCPPEPMGSVFSPQPISLHRQNISQRQVMLNKFIRLAGDLLLQPMYVPYMKMLTSLASNPVSAQYCFNLLSNNSSLGHGRACSISWDHFFNSFKQYYASLRQDLQAQDHTAHLHNHQTISPEELHGLIGVLDLIKMVAEQNTSVRLAFCDNQSWLPIASLFGLLGCSVPAELKAVILETLAAFALSPEIASVLWQSLEASQILATGRQAKGSTSEGGIISELNEIETRNEVYPETRAFIKLIDRLIDICIPATLGAGYRAPGFGPYLSFCMDVVFLKLKGRAYQDELEMWKLASACLQIFVKILSNYSPSSEHFEEQQVEIQGVNFGKAAKPPGLEILIHLLNDTPFLRLVLSLIDDLCKRLEENAMVETFEERTVVYQRTCQLALKLLESGLERQDAFFTVLRGHGTGILASPLDQLLLGVNPNSGRGDYLNRIARLMALRDISPEIPLHVLNIFLHLSQAPTIQREIVGILSMDKTSSLEIMVGFSDLLEIDEPEIQDNLDALEEAQGDAQVRNLVRQKILLLLLSALDQPSPNLTQYLLGFDVKKAIRRTVLQDFGVGGFPKTCLHSIIGLLNEGIESVAGPACVIDTPKLAEQMYQVIYFLCAHHETGEPTQRYLRLNHDFFVNHCRQLPFKLPSGISSEQEGHLRLRLTNQQAWLLKAVAIEVKVTSQNRLRSNLNRLMIALFNSGSADGRESVVGDVTLTQRTLNTTSFLTSDEEKSSRSLISSLLSALEFTQSTPDELILRMFDRKAIDRVISAHGERIPDSGLILCNVKQLHQYLMLELNNSQAGGAVSSRSELMKEVKNVLAYAVECNFLQECVKAKRDAFEAWRQAVEVTFSVCPSDVLSVDEKQAIIIELIQDLLQKITTEDVMNELASPLAATILMLMSQLFYTVNQMSQSSSTFGLNMAPLVVVFQSLIDSIVKSGGTQARMRASLYGAVMYYMQIGQKQKSALEEGVAGSIFGPQMKESWEANALSVLSKYGNTFMEIVCRDACDGPDIGKMLALGVLDRILSIDWQQRWVAFLSSNGYLRHMIDSLMTEDHDLMEMLSPDSVRISPLYAFESKMSLLSKVGATEVGALTLLQCGLLSRLSACQFLDRRPSVDDNANISIAASRVMSMQDPLTPQVKERYHALFMAVCKVLLSIMSSLGPGHKEATTQLQYFVLAHDDLYMTILQDRVALPSWLPMQELSATTSIVALFESVEHLDEADLASESSGRLRGFMGRIQRVVLHLLQKYCNKEYCERVRANILEEHFEGGIPVKASLPYNADALKIDSCLWQIRLNLLTHVRKTVSSSGLSGPYCKVLFAPKFDAPPARDSRTNVTQMPSLGLLIGELKGTSESLTQVREITKQLERKAGTVNEIGPDEAREILAQASSEDTDKLPIAERHQILSRVFDQVIEIRHQQISILTEILENSLYLLWRHLEYYYIHCVPTEENNFDFELPKMPSMEARRLRDPILRNRDSPSSKLLQTKSSNSRLRDSVTKEELHQLKAEAPTYVTDQLMKKTIAAEKASSDKSANLGFTTSMIRRILGLVKTGNT